MNALLASLDLHRIALSALRLCVWLVLLSAIFVPLERLFALHPARVFRAAVWTDLCFYALTSLLPAFVLGAPIAILVAVAHAIIPASFTDFVAGLPFWAKVASALVVGEVGFYWGHRWSHEIPLLWRFHAVHHSATHLDWLVNTRVHPVDMVFTRLCGLAPLAILGLASPVDGATLIPLLVLLLGTVWGFFIHANVGWRFGPFEWLVATPAFHHWHHTNDGPAVINKNYASLLPLVDRVFGTLHLPPRTPVRYGIDDQMPPSFLGQLLHPLRSRSS